MSEATSAGERREGSTDAPRISHAVRALLLMLEDHCNAKSMDDPPHGSCGIRSHEEARAVIRGYKASLPDLARRKP